MPAAYELNSRVIRPGHWAGVWRKMQQDEFVWGGFARSEILAWWMKRGAELVDVPADRFAERSDFDRQLRWDPVPRGHVIRGLVDPNDGKPVLKVLTRAASPEEMTRFQHPRMPLIEPPLFSAEPVFAREHDGDAQQGELGF